MRKVVYVVGTCDFCEHLLANYSNSYINVEWELTKGRIYTLEKEWSITVDGKKGVGYRLVEFFLPEGWGHCSCQFRDVEGDGESWRLLIAKHKSKPRVKELEPA
jgi:hypothetical protein